MKLFPRLDRRQNYFYLRLVYLIELDIYYFSFYEVFQKFLFTTLFDWRLFFFISGLILPLELKVVKFFLGLGNPYHISPVIQIYSLSYY